MGYKFVNAKQPQENGNQITIEGIKFSDSELFN